MLSAIGMSMIAAGRLDVARARNLRAAAIAMAAADGAIQQAAFQTLPCPDQAGCRPWPTDGTPVDASRDGVAITVCLADDAGKVNPNTATPALMAALLAATGTSAPDSTRIADAIAAWRSPEPGPATVAAYRQAGLPYAPDGHRFAAVDDLRFVLGMTQAILDRLRPNLSVWNEAAPDPAFASAATRLALRATDAAALGVAIPGAQPRTFSVTATAAIPRDAQFTRAAIFSLERDPARPPVRILDWSAAPPVPCG